MRWGAGVGYRSISPMGDTVVERARIPERGRDRAALLTEMAAFRDGDVAWQDGRTWSLVYPVHEEHERLLERAHDLFLGTNGLNPMAFPSLKKMEAEVVGMTASMLHGPPEATGTMTSGGTESILLAVKAARDRARSRRPWLRRPEMVLPRTIHAAFDKAGHCFGVRPRYVEIGPDGRADVAAMSKAIGRRTVLVAGSAPQYPHGVVDPIPELAELARRRGIPFHVDACFGGFILPWLERLGVAMPRWDFRVPGVTSISADVHKYGYAAKGASVILYRDIELLRHQFFVATDWPGGIYASPTLPGTRPGGPIAAAWAALQSMGEEGYLELASLALESTRRLRAGVEAIDGLSPMAELQSTIVTWRSDDDDVHVYAVADLMADKGWAVDRQHRPACVHCTVNASNAPVVDEYLADLRAAVQHVRAHPGLRSEGEAAMYGMMAKVPLRRVVAASVRDVLAGMYAPGATAAPDLGGLGQGEDDSPLLKLIGRHQGRLLDVLDRLDRFKRRS